MFKGAIKIYKINLNRKLGSIFAIILILSSGLFVSLVLNHRLQTAKATSVLREATDTDFINGKLENVTIIGSGEDAELRIEISGSPHWVNKTPTTAPPVRYQHAMATIYGTNKILLHGGHKYGWLRDTWLYDIDTNTWTDMNPINKPTGGRHRHAMASVHNDDKVILFGGGDGAFNGGAHFNDTWVYDLSENNWTLKNPSYSPPRKHMHAMATVYGEDKIVLYGGNDGTGSYFNDTWIYNIGNDTWTQKTPKSSPCNRSSHAMAAIYKTDKILLFGGINFKNCYDDTWIYDSNNNTWTNMKPTQHPCGRYSHAMVNIYGTDKVMLFGGTNDVPHKTEPSTNFKTYFNDTWIYDLSENTWTQKIYIQKPAGRCLFAMASVLGEYKAILFGGTFAYWPLLNDTWIHEFSLPQNKGNYISKPYDLGSKSCYKTINWDAVTPVNTSIKFQLRTGSNESDLMNNNFIGPDGTILTYYKKSSSNIWSGHNYDKWVQYKAYFYTSDENNTPILKDVTIIYNNLPQTKLLNPRNGSILSINKPTFTWNFTDLDSESQTSYQVLIDDNPDFSSIDYSSDVQNSPNQNWHFPEGIGYTSLPDGVWYWKVRTKDSDGDWGFYSQPWKFFIDSKTPESLITYPINNTFYNNLNKITGKAFDNIGGLGLNNTKIAIKRLIDNNYWNGSTWIVQEVWLLTSGMNNWSFNSSSVNWISGNKYNIKSKAIDNANNTEIPTPGKFFTYDSENVTFSNVLPSADFISNSESVEVGITISDNISGVDGSTVEFSISTDAGKFWSKWIHIPELMNGSKINITLNLTYPNGTDIFIKWRGCDVAGNGPTESNIYRIKINTWLQQFIPKVQLLLPEKYTLIPTTSIELSWTLMNKGLVGVKYDIYLDTVNPLNTFYETNFTDTRLKVFDLLDNETYYWTVIPKYKDEIGWCLSGVWSFTVNTSVPFPMVKLISPGNGSIISSPRPTLQWSVVYTGSEVLSYNVYLDTNQNPMNFEKLSNNYFMPNYILQDNTTYYWKVIPFAGNITGPSSEIFSFTIKKGYVPHFEIKLELEPVVIWLEPSEIKYVKARVTNKGDLTDLISLDIEIPAEAEIGAIVNEPNRLSAAPENIAIFNITVTSTKDIEPGVVILVVSATSEKATEYGLIIEVKETLKVITSEPAKLGTIISSDNFLILIILVIIIIIILAIILFIFNLKKKRSQDKLVAKEPVTIKPIKIHMPEKVQDKVSSPTVVTQISAKPTVDASQHLAPTPTVSKPTLMPPPTLGQVPVAKRMPEVQQQPQLPPAETQESIKTSNLNSE